MAVTQEHWRIQKWAHEQGAKPAQLLRLKFDGEPAILTFILGRAEGAEREIQPISWESFFAQFDLLGLSMSFEECSPQFDIVKMEKRSAAYPVH